MSLVVGSNPASLAAQRSINASSQTLETAMERLSSGKRINSAADDAAGLAISQRLTAQVNGMDMAVKNATDGQALIQTVESSLNEVSTMLQRMREIAVQAASDTNSVNDRAYLDTEYQALSAELTRISTTAQFNGVKILDGTLSKTFQVGPNASDTISATQGSVAATTLGGFTIDVGGEIHASANEPAGHGQAITHPYAGGNVAIVGNGVTKTVDAGAGASAKTVATTINTETSATGVSATATNEISLAFDSTAAALTFKIGNSASSTTTLSTVTVGASALTAFVNEVNAKSATTGITAKTGFSNTEVILTDVDGDDIYLERTDAQEKDITVTTLKSDGTKVSGESGVLHEGGQTNDAILLTGRVRYTSSSTFTINDPDSIYTGTAGSAVTADSNTISATKLDTQANATTAIQAVDGAIESIARSRATLGSVDARLGYTATDLMNRSSATSDALGKILDADFSKESANLARAQVLQQVGTAMLAQANAQPQLVLQLLQ
jgi:flagellin